MSIEVSNGNSRSRDPLTSLRGKGPLWVQRALWPDVAFYDRQKEVIESVLANKETVTVAGNQLGKDFVSGFIVLWFFLTRSPCRIILTSVAEHHLIVLWDEMDRFIKTSKVPLTVDKGGPLLVKHRQILRVIDGVEDPMSYIWAMVAENPEKMSGHHATPESGEPMRQWMEAGQPPLTLFLCDEASGVPDEYYQKASAWAKRVLIIGNPWPTTNFFFKAVKGDKASNEPSVRRGGDIYSPSGECLRKVIQITAEDSPNVKKAREQIAQGLVPTNEIVTPGVKSWKDYQDEIITWDEHRKSVGHRAEFYEGTDVKLFPAAWLDHAELVADGVETCPVCGRHHPPLLKTSADAIGVDSAQGGDNTAWAAVSNAGLVALQSYKTADTSQIPGDTLAFMMQFGVPPEKTMFDYGGGGKQHVDNMRAKGYNVQGIAFGEAATAPLRRIRGTIEVRSKEKEEKYAYKNRRAEMYGILSLRLDPMGENPFGLPRDIMNRRRGDNGPSLREQLLAFPKNYDGEGRLFLPPKNRKAGVKETEANKSLVDIIGCSPDEADALVLSVFGLVRRASKFAVTAIS